MRSVLSDLLICNLCDLCLAWGKTHPWTMICIFLHVCVSPVPGRVLYLQVDQSTLLSFGWILRSVAWIVVSDDILLCTSELLQRMHCGHLSAKPWCCHKTFVHQSHSQLSFSSGVFFSDSPVKTPIFWYEQQLTLSLNRHKYDLVHSFQLERLNGAFQKSLKWQVS